MATPLTTLVQLLDPWKDVFSKSRPLEVVVIYGHLAAILVGGGIAVTTDLASLRAFRNGGEERGRQVTLLHQSHTIVVGALAVLFVTGLLLIGSDLEAFLASPWFWIKLACVALLVINGAVLYRTGEALLRDGVQAASLWGRLRLVSILSMVLWLTTLLAGTILPIAA